jgi:hypothetical protein
MLPMARFTPELARPKPALTISPEVGTTTTPASVLASMS